MLKTYLEWIRNGDLQDPAAQDLAQIIPSITACIAQLGGTFEYSDYESEPRKDAITWQPCKVIKNQNDNIDLDVGGG
jgi:hypothetical protein